MSIENKIEKYLNESYGEPREENFNGKKYKQGTPIRFSQLKPGDIVYYTYKNGGRYMSDIFKFEGFSDMEQKHGDSGVKFKTWKEFATKYGVSSLAAADKLADAKEEYGHNVYMCGEFNGGEKGCYFYPYKGGWVRGSGADKMSMSIAVPV